MNICGYKHLKLEGFTLAEVLITIAIIGIVSAMTIPTLIQDTKRKEYPVKLAQAYSALSQAIIFAQNDYGDIGTWDYHSYYGAENTSTTEGISNKQIMVKNCAEKYFIPYLKIAQNYGSNIPDKLNIGYYTKDGRAYFAVKNNIRYVVELNNGVILIFTINAAYNTNGDYIITNPCVFVDVNGISKPNVLGRDLYFFELSSKHNKFIPSGYGNSREYLLEKCAGNSEIYSGAYCTALIQMDNWTFKDDYPW